MTGYNAQRKPVEPIFGPIIPTYSPKNTDDYMSWQERALCAQTDAEAFFPEKGGSTREAKLVCQKCSVKSACLDYALSHNERFGIWGGLTERERRRFKNRIRESSRKRLKNRTRRYLRSLIFIVNPRYSPGIVRNVPFDGSDYAFRSNYRTRSINDALQIEIENSSELASYPAISKRLSTLIRLESLTKSNKLIKVPVFPDWENDLFAFIRDRCVNQLANPRDVQIFAEKHFGLSVTLHPVNSEYEFALVANVHPGKISKGFALVDSSQESDLLISISILRALATFLFADAPVSIGKFGFHLEDLTEEIVHYVTSNHLKSESDKRSDFTSKRVLSPYLEASVLKAFSMEEVDISLVANELYEVSDINALEGHLRKSGWGK